MLPYRRVSVSLWRCLALFAALCALAGCATRNTAVLRHDMSTRDVCCASFGEMPSSPLGTEPHKFSLGHGSPLFAFAEGKSYFAAFSLPPEKAPGIVFTSYRQGEFLPDAALFFPSFVFLDRQHQPIETVRDAPMQPGAGAAFVGRLAIPRDAAFVVVFTIGSTNQRVAAISENGTRWVLPLSLAGDLSIALSR